MELLERFRGEESGWESVGRLEESFDGVRRGERDAERGDGDRRGETRREGGGGGRRGGGVGSRREKKSGGWDGEGSCRMTEENLTRHLS